MEVITAYPFTAAQLKVVLVVMRKTYGWRRKKTQISYGMISKLTGLNKRYVKRVVQQLIKDRVLIKEKDKDKNVFGLNKRYLHWRLWITLKKGVPEATSRVSSKTLGSVSQDTTKGVPQDTTLFLKKEIKIDKESSKERPFFIHKAPNSYLKEPIPIGRLISI